MSLRLTRHAPWMSAAELDTSSIELPESWISSLTSSERTTVTPERNCTRRVTFSPRKLRISHAWPSCTTLKLIGKWAYTKRILYRKPLVTPVIMFSMCEHTERIDEPCLPCAKLIATVTEDGFGLKMSARTWPKSRLSSPRGPRTRTRRCLTSTVTPAGTEIVSEFLIVFIFSCEGGKKKRKKKKQFIDRNSAISPPISPKKKSC
mmetsp:Transcript_22518/g.50413  ORF Transcript_22518/g.50413 Transcript_22518/m.50413 type:complete len:205 (-) Transcript_22518:138-752(-)